MIGLFNKLENAFFDIDSRFNKILIDLGFKLLQFRFHTRDEVLKDSNNSVYNEKTLIVPYFI